MEKKTYKYCIVPLCTNTTIRTPQKIFFSVSKGFQIRKKWCNAMGRDERKYAKLSDSTPLYCCEDHFNLEQDMENYWQYKLMGNVRVKLKNQVLPHIFDCQQRKVKTITDRSAGLKRKLLDEATAETSVLSEASTSSQVPQKNITELATEDTPLGELVQVSLRAPFRSKGIKTTIHVKSVVSSSFKCISGSTPCKVQSVKKPRKKLFGESKTTDHIFTVPFKVEQNNGVLQLGSEMEDESPSLQRIWNSSTSDTDLNPGEMSNSSNSASGQMSGDEFKKYMREGTLMAIQREPKLLLGVPHETYFTIKILSANAPTPTLNIYIVLKKIRLNNSFAVLSLDFGLSRGHISRIFKETLPILASLLQQLIIFPKPNKVKLHLPISFRASYGKVVSIINCLEIQIEKPSNSVHQELTWSKYKACNTLKYLISCTPDGFVNFISEGYGGRASDVAIVEDCGFIDKLAPGVGVMAGSGFKNVSNILASNQCSLVRPPSVLAKVSSTPQEVKSSKRIDALRINVEQIINRLREFRMLLPNARVDYHHVNLMDCIIIIACGIINVQDYLIKS